MAKGYRKHLKKLFGDTKRKEGDRQLKQMAESDEPLVICLTNDFAFKKTFRNKIALTGLLSSLLAIPEEEIVRLEFPDTFLHGEYAEDREGILDVKVHLNHSVKINIEIQLLSYPYWEERSLFYLSRMYAEDFLKGQDFGALESCIHISILGFPLKGAEHFYSVIRLMDEKTGRIYSDRLSLRVLYLSKLDTCSEEERHTEVYHWAKLISARDWRVLKEMAKRNKYMKEAVEEMERLNADKELRYLYLQRLMAASDETTMRNYYKRLEEEAKKIGLAEGREEGIKALIEDSLEDGKDKDTIIVRLQKRFSLTREAAACYYDQYSK